MLLGNNECTAGQNPVVAQVYIRPFQLEYPMTLDRIGMRHGTANGNFRAAIYADNGDTPVGGALLVESASIAVAWGVQEIPIGPISLPAGLYWRPVMYDDATDAVLRCSTTTLIDQFGTLGMHEYLRGGGVYGAFVDPCPATVIEDTHPFVGYLRVASVP